MRSFAGDECKWELSTKKGKYYLYSITKNKMPKLGDLGHLVKFSINHNLV